MNMNTSKRIGIETNTNYGNADDRLSRFASALQILTPTEEMHDDIAAFGGCSDLNALLERTAKRRAARLISANADLVVELHARVSHKWIYNWAPSQYLNPEDALPRDTPRCGDCGEPGKMTGHMECQYPQDHE